MEDANKRNRMHRQFPEPPMSTIPTTSEPCPWEALENVLLRIVAPSTRALIVFRVLMALQLFQDVGIPTTRTFGKR